MQFFRKDDNGLIRNLGHHKDGEGDIFVGGEDIPNPIQKFRVLIKEVAEDLRTDSNYAKRNLTTKVYWTISLIKVKEYKFNMFGKRLWRHEL